MSNGLFLCHHTETCCEDLEQDLPTGNWDHMTSDVINSELPMREHRLHVMSCSAVGFSLHHFLSELPRGPVKSQNYGGTYSVVSKLGRC